MNIFFYSRDDKLILKVCSNTEALLALVDFDPEFVSQNEHDAQIECDVIFALGYVSISEEEAEAELKMDELYGEKNDEEEETEEGLIGEPSVDAKKPDAEAETEAKAEAENADVKNDANNGTDKSNTE